jgi:hypothetical protein
LKSDFCFWSILPRLRKVAERYPSISYNMSACNCCTASF